MRNKRTIIIAMVLSICLFSGCGKEPQQSENPPVNSADSQQAQEVQKPSLNDAGEIDRLEESLGAKFDCITEVEITQEESQYYVKLTLASEEDCASDELKDSVINQIIQAYSDVTEEQITLQITA